MRASFFLEAHTEPPERVVLDLDTTDLPLYIFAGEHLFCARLRTANQDASAGSKEEVERIVGQIRAAWPAVEIILRADSGFCRKELMQWCEEHGVGNVFGFARSDRLRQIIAPQMEEAPRQQTQTGRAARVFAEFVYQTTTGSWSRARRVVAKAEQLEGKENPRYVVTNLGVDHWPARQLYEDLYCARGEMEKPASKPANGSQLTPCEKSVLVP